MATKAYIPLAIFVIIVLLIFLFVSGNKRAKVYNSENFVSVQNNSFPDPQIANQSIASVANPNVSAAQTGVGNINPSDADLGDEMFSRVVGAANASAPGSATCFPRDRLTASDLLPKDAANSRWAQLNPAGQGDVSDQNFLTAGVLIGTDTVGSSKKNANLQLRSEPANPQVNVSPWNQSTISPSDVGNRLPLEIGGDY
jgi:hypothetical protein